MADQNFEVVIRDDVCRGFDPPCGCMEGEGWYTNDDGFKYLIVEMEPMEGGIELCVDCDAGTARICAALNVLRVLWRDDLIGMS